ncbi:MAG: hypothetical protein ACQEVA_07880 [Myxococcota bacterium]
MNARLCLIALSIALLFATACSSKQQPEDTTPTETQTAAAEADEAPTEPAPDEIPNAIATGTDTDNACGDLPGANFVSIEDLSGGETIDRAVMTFTDEAYEWTYQDDVRTGIYDCEGGRITGYADAGNQMRSGQYTPKDGRLQWRSMEFQMVSE